MNATRYTSVELHDPYTPLFNGSTEFQKHENNLFTKNHTFSAFSFYELFKMPMLTATEFFFKSKSNLTQNQMVKLPWRINVDDIKRIIIEFGNQYEAIDKSSLRNKRNAFNPNQLPYFFETPFCGPKSNLCCIEDESSQSRFLYGFFQYFYVSLIFQRLRTSERCLGVWRVCRM